MTIGIIGAGNMGGAIAKGLACAGKMNQQDILVSDIAENNLARIRDSYPNIQTFNDNRRVAKSDLVIVAVKPWLVGEVLKEIGDVLDASKQALIVVAAGVSLDRIYEWLPNELKQLPCYRLMPNTAIELQESMSLLSARNSTPEQDSQVMSLLGLLGKVVMIPEGKMAAGTSLTSCGTAYALRYIRAAVEAAVEMGFYPAEATQMVAQTVKGAAELLLQHQSQPEVEIDKVTTPGGITIKGLNEMEANGFSNAVIKGHKASTL